MGKLRGAIATGVCVQTSRNELLSLLDKPSLRGIPLLVLGNKNDLPGALTTPQLIDQLGLKVRSADTGPLPQRMVLAHRLSACCSQNSSSEPHTAAVM